jgi:uncharacterized integral membrane protein (TIGR00698 family)
MWQIPRFLPAWLVLFGIALAGFWLAKVIPGPGNITFALLLAMIVGNVYSWSDNFKKVFQYTEKHLLAMATILLGFGLNIRLLQQLSPVYLLVIAGMVVLTLLSSQWFCSKMSVPLRWLLGAGSGICGNSAIAATAPVLGASVTEIGLAVTVVNLLGTIGIFLFPPLAALFGLSEAEAALFTGAILQSVGHVVAAGYSISPETGALALLIKMGRILMLGPMILFIGYRMKNNAQRLSLKLVPNYVWGFLVAALLTSSQLLPEEATKGAEKAGIYLLLLAMTGIGLGINLRQMINLGPKAALSGTLIFATQIAVLLTIIHLARLT